MLIVTGCVAWYTSATKKTRSLLSTICLQESQRRQMCSWNKSLVLQLIPKTSLIPCHFLHVPSKRERLWWVVWSGESVSRQNCSKHSSRLNSSNSSCKGMLIQLRLSHSKMQMQNQPRTKMSSNKVCLRQYLATITLKWKKRAHQNNAPVQTGSQDVKPTL